jgi:hypothetical protein
MQVAHATEPGLNVSDGVAKPRKRERAQRPHSAVTSGRKLFVDGDPHSPWSDRFRDLVAGHVSDLGGADVLSAAQVSLVRRASAIECECESMEGRLSKGLPVDLDIFTRSASHLRRILETLGLERKPRDVSDDLYSYMREKAAQKAAGESVQSDSPTVTAAGDGVSWPPNESDGHSESERAGHPFPAASGEATRDPVSAAASPALSDGGADHG